MPSQSTTETTAELLLFAHAETLSTCPIWTLAKPVSLYCSADLADTGNERIWAYPKSALSSYPSCRITGRSSEPTDIPTTRLVKAVPNFEMAERRTVISSSNNVLVAISR
jgi:hypothetical protein